MKEMEKRNFINGYYLLEQDLKTILSFIEPTEKNFLTYSHRLYSLFIRSCIEFEANCKAILVEVGCDFKLSNANIKTYFKIHEYPKYKFIKNYIVRLQLSEEINLKPLTQWTTEENGPCWYRKYNDIKHSRVEKFDEANLENVLNATAAVFILLHARYDVEALNQYQKTSQYEEDDDGFISKESSLFKIKSEKTHVSL